MRRTVGACFTFLTVGALVFNTYGAQFSGVYENAEFFRFFYFERYL